jgi:uncharacterized UPF0160 family protein
LFYLLQAIDAIDNGINQYDTDQPPKYVNNTHLSSRVGKFNLDWTDPDQSSKKENEAFERAMALAGSEFLDVSFYFVSRVRFFNKLFNSLFFFFFCYHSFPFSSISCPCCENKGF